MPREARGAKPLKSRNAEGWTVSSRISCDDRVMAFAIHPPDFFLGIEAHVHLPALRVTASTVRRSAAVLATNPNCASSRPSGWAI